MKARLIVAVLLLAVSAVSVEAAGRLDAIENDGEIHIETDAISTTILKKGYVSGIAGGSFIDKKTGAKDLGFGLQVMDFLLAPGWADDGYERDARLHGNLAKHYVEGPQLCTHAKELHPQMIRGENFVAIKMQFQYTQPAAGLKAGSTWEQTLIFQPGVRYVLSAERITSVNDVDNLCYRLDMPGHIRHHGDDTFEQVYLSYLKELIHASAFVQPFGPDEKLLYQRNDEQIPQRMIRGYQVKLNGKPGPWLAGMTLDPAEVSEAWCHERGYVCMIEEIHRRHVKAGESFGAAYVVGWFDDIAHMQQAYDRYKGATKIVVDSAGFRAVP